ncbi:hypothetical protein N790_02240 [Arenimonas malthae CC-JY-1]|uniref:TonB C-terminal domain-containing protein n=1 Tax=Arenimonas malthae CC-JY-1 TaxID=1384054 RepID=A0A091B3P0_9GAMM|nr:hypothetical protein [Arenimonas malthae]KFN45449.1 hypothetical protein N790_02240 [Arenimonas malthae CC-JY-1]
MNPWFRSIACAFLLWLPSLAAQAADAPAGEVRKLPLVGWIEISAQGRMTAFEFDPAAKVPPVLQPTLTEQLQSAAFVPATRDGKPAPSRSWLTARVVIRHLQGDDYHVGLEGTQLGPKPLLRETPRLALGTGDPIALVVAFTVTPEGVPANVEAQGVRHATRAHLGVARLAIARWRFEPEQVGGEPVASLVRLPIVLAKTTFDAPMPAVGFPPAPLPEGRPGAPGQDGYLPALEIRAVRRGTPRGDGFRD